MGRVRVNGFSLSIDGFGAGLHQDIDNPIGTGGLAMLEWALGTRVFCEMHGGDGGSTGIDNDFAARGFENVGAWVLGRNMFGPIRGAWPDDAWKGWWGDTPPYHVPVFVLTHHPREALPMNGDTTFHFVTGGIHEALERAKAAAGDKDVRIGGGVATIRQFILADLVDELHLVMTPVALGAGESLFAGINLTSLGFTVTEHVTSPNAMHVVLTKS